MKTETTGERIASQEKQKHDDEEKKKYLRTSVDKPNGYTTPPPLMEKIFQGSTLHRELLFRFLARSLLTFQPW
jgi:hypothetical protein